MRKKRVVKSKGHYRRLTVDLSDTLAAILVRLSDRQLRKLTSDLKTSVASDSNRSRASKATLNAFFEASENYVARKQRARK